MTEGLDTLERESPLDWIPNIKVALFDFDGTIANTFEKSPRGVDVGRACEIAVESVLGADALRVYRNQGGLMNRSPSELVSALFADRAIHRESLLKNAEEYLRSHKSELERVVPEGKGVALEWGEGDAKTPGILTELFVRAKLLALLPEVGKVDTDKAEKRWPEPMPGFLDFLAALRAKGISVGIITAGHDEFIRRTFSLWGIPCPLLVTDDDMRAADVPEKDRMKPGRYPADLLYARMIWKAGQEAQPDWGKILAHPNEIAYFGDDYDRDGGLARNAGMRFGWYRPKQTGGETADAFADWGVLRLTLDKY